MQHGAICQPAELCQMLLCAEQRAPASTPAFDGTKAAAAHQPRGHTAGRLRASFMTEEADTAQGHTIVASCDQHTRSCLLTGSLIAHVHGMLQVTGKAAGPARHPIPYRFPAKLRS